MPPTRQIKAFIQDASGSLVPLAADSLVLEFPTGDTLEVTWDDPHENDPRPLSAQLWGGRRPGEQAAQPSDAPMRTAPVALIPSAANLVLVYPYPGRNRD